jgi:glycosyltransferase involved in cell wall biosynthesis
LNGATVKEYFFREQRGNWLTRIIDFLRTHQRTDYDILWIGISGHILMPLFRFIAKGPVIFDAFFSLYQTVVSDKRLCSPRGIRSRYWRLLDIIGCRMSDRVVLDTHSQIDYFIREYNLWPGRFVCIPVGADDCVFTPVPAFEEKEPFTVSFWGSFIPLQGVNVIIEAASRLKDTGVLFTVLGKNPESKRVKELSQRLDLKNVKFLPRVDYTDLPDYQAKSHICLGIFGETEKARQVIPNKAYTALAMERPLITGDSPAVREVFRHGESAWLVPMGDPDALALAILHLREHPEERYAIAKRGHKLYLERFTVSHIGAIAVAVAGELLQPRNPLEGRTEQHKASEIDEENHEGVDPEMMFDHRPDISRLVPITAKRILDVGCGIGYLGRVLKAREGTEVVGVEVLKSAAHEARLRLDAVFTEYDALKDSYDPEYFDCLIFGDVLEHMVSPRKELKRYLLLLKPGGTVIASLPNIAHWTIHWELLMNRFKYEPRGIRCNSHLRFFTSRSVRAFLKSAGLDVRKIIPNYRLFDRSFFGKVFGFSLICKLLSLYFLRHLFAYQYRIVAIKPDRDNEGAG